MNDSNVTGLIDDYLNQLNYNVELRESFKNKVLFKMEQYQKKFSEMKQKIPKSISTEPILEKKIENKIESNSLVEDYLIQIRCSENIREEYKDKILSNMADYKKKFAAKVAVSFESSKIDENQIKLKAEEISSWKNDYNTLVWLWAETTLKLKNKINPTNKEIEVVAKEFSKKEKNIEKITWFLAENYLKLN